MMSPFSSENRELWAKVFSLSDDIQIRQYPPDYKIPTEADRDAYRRGENRGLYDNINDMLGHDSSSVQAREIACAASPFLVHLSCPTDGYRPLMSSGIVFEFHGAKKILTSTYLIGDRSLDAIFSVKVDVVLPNRKKVTGRVSVLDKHHNVMIIHAELHEDPEVKAATFDLNAFKLGTKVTAIYRNWMSELRASNGEINVRNDHLESDDVLSSSCTIAEYGIGGPLISNFSGSVVGMNFFGKKGFTPFMPSNIVLICIELLMTRGSVICPWIGLKARSLNELKIDELELLFTKFNCPSGLSVREVIKGSPADKSGICVGDVIVPYNKGPVNSPFELTEILLKMHLPTRGKGRRTSRKRKSIKVHIFKMSTGTIETKCIAPQSSSSHVNRWPLW